MESEESRGGSHGGSPPASAPATGASVSPVMDGNMEGSSDDEMVIAVGCGGVELIEGSAEDVSAPGRTDSVEGSPGDAMMGSLSVSAGDDVGASDVHVMSGAEEAMEDGNEQGLSITATMVGAARAGEGGAAVEGSRELKALLSDSVAAQVSAVAVRSRCRPPFHLPDAYDPRFAAPAVLFCLRSDDGKLS